MVALEVISILSAFASGLCIGTGFVLWRLDRRVVHDRGETD